MNRKAMIVAVIALLAVTVFSGSLLSQTERTKPDSRAEAMLKRMEKLQAEREPPQKQAENQAFREALEATNAQWGVIKPRLRTLLDLREEAKVAVTHRSAPRTPSPETSQAGGASTGPAAQGTGQYQNWSWKRPWQGKDKLTRAEQACDDLVSLLEKPDATDEQKRQKLNALRQVKEQINKELLIVRQELRELLTPRQHARLVLTGLLD